MAHQLVATTCSRTWCAPGPVMRDADALALVAILQHADGNRAGQRRARIEHLASINVAGHGRNTADRRRYRFPGSTSRPGPERTAHQLAAPTCSCTWCASGQVVRGADALALVAILQHADGNCAGQRRARIEHLASSNVAARGRTIDLVDVRMLTRIHIAVPALRWRQDRRA